MASKRQTFLYFAYGSNLWTKRIQLQNKSAIRRGIAQLKVSEFEIFCEFLSKLYAIFLIFTIFSLFLQLPISSLLSLQNYRLDFYKPASEPSIWNGASANVIEDETKSVWGAVWEIDLMDMASLDAQEGVHLDMYVPLIKEVHTPDDEVLECRLYQMSVAPTNPLKLYSEPIPLERKPSKSLYFLTIPMI